MGVAYAGYLPKLDIYGETGPQYIDSPVLQSQGGGSWISVAEVLGARLTQNVFDGFATPGRVRSARFSLEAAEFTLEGVRQNVLFDGINAYVEVLRQNNLLALARNSDPLCDFRLRSYSFPSSSDFSFRDTELMQYRWPVGAGPSSKRWPRCAPQRLQ